MKKIITGALAIIVTATMVMGETYECYKDVYKDQSKTFTVNMEKGKTLTIKGLSKKDDGTYKHYVSDIVFSKDGNQLIKLYKPKGWSIKPYELEWVNTKKAYACTTQKDKQEVKKAKEKRKANAQKLLNQNKDIRDNLKQKSDVKYSCNLYKAHGEYVTKMQSQMHGIDIYVNDKEAYTNEGKNVETYKYKGTYKDAKYYENGVTQLSIKEFDVKAYAKIGDWEYSCTVNPIFK